MKEKMNLYIYPNAKPHEHDTNASGMTTALVNTVPLSRIGIEKHCNIVEPDKADYFYMGQFANDTGELVRAKPSDYKYFEGQEHKHICDIDGEGGFEASHRPAIPPWLHNSIITTMGPLKSYANLSSLFARPTFSHLLIDIIKNENETFNFPNTKSFGFRGMVNCKIRALMLYCLHNMDCNKEIKINKKWEGLSAVGSNTQEEYINTMLKNSLSLCPRGSGIDSVRLIESCYYNRVPILISDRDYFLVGEDSYDTSFCFRVCGENMTPDFLKEELLRIYETPINVLKERADLARKYFDEVIREYFKDPTLYFLKWLENK